MPGTFSPALFLWRLPMSDISLFLDESGSDGLREAYYILALVIHDQSDLLDDELVKYGSALSQKGLPDIPFHATPLLNGHGDYEGVELAERKRLLSTFRVFFRHLPIKYHLIVLENRRYDSLQSVSGEMRRQIVSFLFDNLGYFQRFDRVKIYYDNGQQSIAEALHKAIEYALSKNAVTFRLASPMDYRLSQAADYICSMELTALKYLDKTTTVTDEKFFGRYSEFKRGALREVRAKRLEGPLSR